MCGISGIIDPKAVKSYSSMVREMIDTISHRGPDDEGVYIDDTIGLGHKRLAIIDISGGKQPMISRDGRYVLVYNGELYNYLELREKLEKSGIRFDTRSDSEVLLYWMAEMGIEGLKDLNGMFAFAFWDARNKVLLLARDRLGIKPLYYKPVHNGLFFASEIKAILKVDSKKQANHQAIFEFLTFQNMLSDHTFFKSIYRLLPGHWLTWKPGGVSTGSYWDVVFDRESSYSFATAVEAYTDALKRSVKRHMISDVPVGAYLSGGFDSTSVATLANELTPETLHTFTGAFTDDDYYDERIGSRSVAQQLNAHIHEIEISAEDYIRNIARVIYHLDEPTLGTGAFPQYMVSKLVSEHVKVVLTGHGGDEMFGGYQVNKVALIKQTLRKHPAGVFSIVRGIRRDELTRVLYYLLYPLVYPEVGYGLFIMIPRKNRETFLSPRFLKDQNGYEPFDSLKPFVEGVDDLPGERILRLYLRTYLPTLFIQEDKVSMAHSVEARTPLCDNEMVDLALKIPLNIKLWGNELKAITKAAMRPHLPDVLYQLPKRGFPTPFARWYRNPTLRYFMEDLLFGQTTTERGIFNTTELRKLFQKNLNSGTDTLYDYARANQLYSMSVIELWFRTFIDPGCPAPVAFD